MVRFEAAMEAHEEKEVKRRQKSMKPLMDIDHFPRHIRIWRHILLVQGRMEEQNKFDQECYK